MLLLGNAHNTYALQVEDAVEKHESEQTHGSWLWQMKHDVGALPVYFLLPAYFRHLPSRPVELHAQFNIGVLTNAIES